MKQRTLSKKTVKNILLIGLNSGLLGLPLAAPPAVTAHMLSQQVIAEPSSPNAAQGEWHRAWSRQQEEKFLAEAKRALATRDAASLLKLYDWSGVTSDARRSSTQEAKDLGQRKIQSIAVQPKGLGGNIGYIQDGRLYTPNGTVVAHLIFKPNDGSAAVDLPLGMRGGKLAILGFCPKSLQ